MFAVSMKLPPASLKASYIRRDSSLGAPQPRSSPKVMVPRHNSETRKPLCPNSLYRMDEGPRWSSIAGAERPDEGGAARTMPPPPAGSRRRAAATRQDSQTRSDDSRQPSPVASSRRVWAARAALLDLEWEWGTAPGSAHESPSPRTGAPMKALRPPGGQEGPA